MTDMHERADLVVVGGGNFHTAAFYPSTNITYMYSYMWWL